VRRRRRGAAGEAAIFSWVGALLVVGANCGAAIGMGSESGMGMGLVLVLGAWCWSWRPSLA
jgi:hypothetical protein